MPRLSLETKAAITRASVMAVAIPDAAQYVALIEQKKQIELQLAPLKESLLMAVRESGEEDAEGKRRLDTPAAALLLVETTTERLDEKKLLGLGVSPRILRAAKVSSTSSYVKVTAKKEM